MCDYLRDVLCARVPAICKMSRDGASVRGGVFCVKAEHSLTGQRECFDYNNRLRLLAEVVAAEGIITLESGKQYGNATCADVHADCPICRAEIVDGEGILLGCDHYFHAGCVWNTKQGTRCALCRQDAGEWDRVMEICRDAQADGRQCLIYRNDAMYYERLETIDLTID